MYTTHREPQHHLFLLATRILKYHLLDASPSVTLYVTVAVTKRWCPQMVSIVPWVFEPLTWHPSIGGTAVMANSLPISSWLPPVPEAAVSILCCFSQPACCSFLSSLLFPRLWTAFTQTVLVDYRLPHQQNSVSGPGCPQGWVLSPMLYTLYTNNCINKHSANTIKVCVDATIIGNITNNDKEQYMEGMKFLRVVCWHTTSPSMPAKPRSWLLTSGRGEVCMHHWALRGWWWKGWAASSSLAST